MKPRSASPLRAASRTDPPPTRRIRTRFLLLEQRLLPCPNPLAAGGAEAAKEHGPGDSSISGVTELRVSTDRALRQALTTF